MNGLMSRKPVSALLAGFAGQVPDVMVRDVAMDSRQVSPDSLFLACRGHSGHGLQYAAEAAARGAAFIAWEPGSEVTPPLPPVQALEVEALSSRAGEIAARFWEYPSKHLQIVGVTGTDGKSSTAHLLAQAWEVLQTPALYVGTLGHGRLDTLVPSPNTTPDAVTLQRIFAGAVARGRKAAAVEISSHALAQNRIGGTTLAAAILTNVGRDHLDYHETTERYAAAKRSLFDRDSTGVLVFNRDDRHGREWALQLADRHPVVLYGIGGTAPAVEHVIGHKLMLHSRGLAMQLSGSHGTGSISSALLGRFNAYNLLAAAAALCACGVPLPEACMALSSAHTVPGRAEAFHGPCARPIVVVDYAHTPQGLSEILKALRQHVIGRLICVFGCGGDRDRGKRAMMGAVVAQFADALIITDDNPRSEPPSDIAAQICEGIPTGMVSVQIIHDRAQAISAAVENSSTEDMVLVAGKGHESYQIYGDERHFFSDREFVAKLTGAEPRT